MIVERTFDPSLAPPSNRESARQQEREAERRRRVIQQQGGPLAAFERSRNLVNLIRTSTFAFWDTYLKNETKGRQYLGKLKDRSDVKAASK